MTRLLVVGCGFPQLSLLRRARALGIEVWGVDQSETAIGVAECHHFEAISTSDVDAVRAFVIRAGLKHIASTGSEVSVRTTAHVAATLGLPFYATPETIRRCQEKNAMRAGYEAAGLRVPTFTSCTRVDEARNFLARVGTPVVIKPARGWGQRGVARVNSTSELDVAFEAALSVSRSAGVPSVVVEEWIQGREFSVNGWIEDGTLVGYCVTERITFPGSRPLGVMEAEVFASGLSVNDEARVIETARKGAAALGHVRGPCYTQVAFDGTHATLFETAARLGGGFDADVTQLATGVDLYRRLIGIALSNPKLEHEGPTDQSHEGAAVKFFTGPTGRLQSVSGLDAARALPGITACEVFVPVGGTIHPLTDSAKRLGYALAHGKDRQVALSCAAAAISAVVLKVHEGTQP